MASARPRKRSLSSDESSDAESDNGAGRSEQHHNAHRHSQVAAPHESGSYAKVQRTSCDPSTSPAPSQQSAFTCTLPPLCSSSPKSFATSEALTSHYSTHHAHVCSAPRCNKIFPSEHFLDLHLREFHDPIVALQRENGSKTVRLFAAGQYPCETKRPTYTLHCPPVQMLCLDLRQEVLHAKEAALASGRLPQVSQGGEVGCDPLLASCRL